MQLDGSKMSEDACKVISDVENVDGGVEVA